MAAHGTLRVRERRRQRFGSENAVVQKYAVFYVDLLQTSRQVQELTRSNTHLWLEVMHDKSMSTSREKPAQIPVTVTRGVLAVLGTKWAFTLCGGPRPHGRQVVGLTRFAPLTLAQGRAFTTLKVISLGIDGIPWEIHAIDDLRAREAAKTAYLSAL